MQIGNSVFTLHAMYSDNYCTCRYIGTGIVQKMFISIDIYIQDSKTQQEHTYMYIIYL